MDDSSWAPARSCSSGRVAQPIAMRIMQYSSSGLPTAVAATQRGAHLTQAALAAGFSDSAHLSRTFRSMFGLSPSLVLPHAEIVGIPA